MHYIWWKLDSDETKIEMETKVNELETEIKKLIEDAKLKKINLHTDDGNINIDDSKKKRTWFWSTT